MGRSSVSNLQVTLKEVTERFDKKLLESEKPRQIVMKFNCSSIDPSEISDVVYELGVESVMMEMDQEKTEVPVNDEERWNDPPKFTSWDSAILKAEISPALDPKRLLKKIKDVYPLKLFTDIYLEEIEDKDWDLEIQKTWRPISVGNLTIYFPWHKDDSDHPKTKFNLTLEGGSAFGTGDHATTKLCCQWLEREITKKRTLSDQRNISVMDFGCGSGVLGLAALIFGATRCDGIDLDRNCLSASLRNAQNNGLKMNVFLADQEENIPTSQSDNEKNSLAPTEAEYDQADNVEDSFPSVLEIEGQEYDFVIANVLASALIELAPQLSKFVKKEGQLAFSGLTTSQAELVMSKYRSYFRSVEIEAIKEDWILVTCKHRIG